MFHRLERFLGAALTGVLAFSLVAVPLAMAGIFLPLPVGVGTVVVWIVLWRVWVHGEDLGAASGRRSGATAAVLLVVLAVTAVNVRYSSQHVLTDRDPGVYVATARWLASEGELLVDPQDEPYAGVRNEHRIRYASAGYYEGHRDDGKLYPQFVHLLPTTIAAGAWIGGSRGMLKVNALLGGLALLLFFAFAVHLVRPWPAAGATAALALSLVQTHFTRDAYTEILTQLLLFGGFWVLLSARPTLHAGRALIAGLAVGASSMARVDAFIFLLPLAIYAIYELASGRLSLQRGRDRAYLGALAAGAVVPSVIAWLDASWFSPVYLADLWPSVRLVWVALALVIGGGAALLYAKPRLPDAAAWLRSHREQLALGSAIGFVALLVLAYLVRPHVQTATQDVVNRFVENLQRAEGLPVNGRRTYAEDSVHWLELYLGPLALWGGVIGTALMGAEIVRGRLRRAVVFLFALLPMLLLYVWEPSITPDHVWAMRRFLPVVIPGLLLACFWLVARLYAADGPRRIAAAVLAAGAVAFPLWTLAPVVQDRTQLGVLSVTDKLCDFLPEDAAVLVAQTALLDQNLTQVVRGFCGVPAANAPMDQPLDWYAELSRRWEEHGRVLYVVSPQPAFGTHWPAEGATYIATVTYRNLERTLTGRPDEFDSYTLSLYVRRADVGADA